MARREVMDEGGAAEAISWFLVSLSPSFVKFMPMKARVRIAIRLPTVLDMCAAFSF